MYLSSNSLQKFTSLITLVTFLSSLFAPLQYVAFAGTPDATVTYSSNPAGTGSLTISIETTEALAPGATISIDQPGSVDIVDAPLTDLGAGTGFTYVYTVMADDGSNYIDGTATVTLSGVSLSTSEPVNLISGGSFTISTAVADTTPPVVTLSGGNITLSLGSPYIEYGASWTDNVDGSGDTFVGTYGSPGSFAISGSVNTGAVGAYYLDYMKVDNAGNGSGATRRVDVVSPVNLRNATIAPPANDKISNIANQEIGRFGLSAGIDAIRFESVDISNVGTSMISTIAASATGVELREVSGNTLLAIGSISGQTISFSGVNFLIPSYTTTNLKIVLVDVGTLDPYYGQTLILTTNSGSMGVVRDSDNAPLIVDESMYSTGGMKPYTISIVPPIVTLTANNPLNTSNRIGILHIANADIGTGLTLSGINLSFLTNHIGSFSGTICLRDIASSANCGSTGTTINPIVFTQSGVAAIISFDGLTGAPETLGQSGGSVDYELFFDVSPSPSWVNGDFIQMRVDALRYFAGGVSIYNEDSTITNVTYGTPPLDTTPPVVTLSGSATVNIEYGNSYVELGASWTDNVDGSGSAFTGTYGAVGSFTLSGTVNTGALGTYMIEYKKVDVAGNSSGAMRTVVVQDTTAPMVTLSGSAIVSIVVGSGYTDAGANWTDLYDGAGSIPSYNSGFLDANNTGSYTIIYQYTDTSGNTGSVSRTVNVLAAPDMTPPVVTLVGSGVIDIEYGNSYTENGANWTDNVDGSGFIPTATSGSVNTGALGTYILEYSYTDGAGNSGSVSRTVNVVDTTAPVVTLSGPATINIEYGNSYTELGASWTDLYDGAGSIPSATSGSVNTGALGTYTLEYTYTDISGNTGTTTRTVTIVDTTAPVVTLSGSASVNIEYGTDYTENGANWTDLYDGSGALPGPYSGSVNTGALGTYTLDYRYVDSAGNTGSVSRTVNVVDTTAPVVTLIGSGVVAILSGTIFSDSGAIWVDLHDGAGSIPSYNSGTLDVNTVGTYTIEYTYADISGNTGATARVVQVLPVPDTIPPVMTLSGSSTVNVEYGNDFVDDGASWTDNVDGSGFIPTATSGSVNTGSLGTYTLEYHHTDMAGNTGTMVTRTVHVVDTTAPMVTLSGSSTVNVEYGTSYTENGANWTDTHDGIGSIPSATSGSVNAGTLGSYTLGYSHTDTSGNTGSVSRTVNVVDTTAPVVTLMGSGIVTILSGTVFGDSGATWTDLYDGAGSIPSYNSGTLDVNTVGTYTLGYSYTDGAGNTGSVSRTVNVIAAPDTTPPTVTLSGSSTVNVEYGNDFVDDGATWTDNVDGAGFIPAYNSGTVNTGALGSYSISYEYTDSSSNVGIGATRTVVVQDTTAPVVTPIGGATVSLVAGSIYTESGATWTDLYDGAGSVGVYSGSVDTNTVGTYMIEYRYTDTSSNVGIAFRTVNVLAAPDTTPPVITLSGSSTVYVEYGSGFIDDGATWTDNVDGSGFIPAYNSGSVNTMALGTYTIGYSYTDGAGNTGSVSRTVSVVDTTAPVVILSGVNPDNVVINNVYSDPGASWTDAVDGSGSILATSGSVNTGALGTYILEYRYTDGAGNSGSVSRTVNVIAAPAPVISMSGSFTGTGPVNVTGTSSVNSGTVIDLNGFPINLTTTSGSLSISGSTDIVVQGSGSWDGVISNPVQSLVNILELTDGGVGSSLPANTPSIIYNHRVVLTIQAGATDGSSLVASGGLFTLRYMINDPGITVGTTLNILRSQDASTWVQSSPAPTCTLDGARFCTFTTNHLSYFGFVSSTAMPITSSPSSGAGGGSASSAVGVSPVFSSAPLNPSSITTNTNPMALGITTLQRMLNDSSKKETQNPSNRDLSIDSKNIIVSDVADSRYKEAIVKMVEKGYMKNTKKFDPKRAMTRAEFIKVLSLAYGFEEFTDFDTSFSDLQGSEFEKYVNFGVIMGWINPDMEKFRPNDAITMGEARKLINAAKEQSDAHAPAMNKEILSREHGANLIFEEIVIL